MGEPRIKTSKISGGLRDIHVPGTTFRHSWVSMTLPHNLLKLFKFSFVIKRDSNFMRQPPGFANQLSFSVPESLRSSAIPVLPCRFHLLVHLPSKSSFWITAIDCICFGTDKYCHKYYRSCQAYKQFGYIALMFIKMH